MRLLTSRILLVSWGWSWSWSCLSDVTMATRGGRTRDRRSRVGTSISSSSNRASASANINVDVVLAAIGNRKKKTRDRVSAKTDSTAIRQRFRDQFRDRDRTFDKMSPKEVGTIHNEMMDRVFRRLVENRSSVTNQVQFDAVVMHEVRNHLCTDDLLRQERTSHNDYNNNNNNSNGNECVELIARDMIRSKGDAKRIFDEYYRTTTHTSTRGRNRIGTGGGLMDMIDSLLEEVRDDNSNGRIIINDSVREKMHFIFATILKLQKDDDDHSPNANEVIATLTAFLDQETKELSEQQRYAVQSVASIARSSTEFWMDVSTDPSHNFHVLHNENQRRRRNRQQIRSTEDVLNNVTTTSSYDNDWKGFGLDPVPFVVADALGALRAVLAEGLFAVLSVVGTAVTGALPVLFAARFVMTVAVSAVLASVETLGIRFPTSQTLVECLLGHLFNTTTDYDQLFSRCNSTVLFGDTGGVLYDQFADPLVGPYVNGLLGMMEGVLPWLPLFDDVLDHPLLGPLVTAAVSLGLSSAIALVPIP